MKFEALDVPGAYVIVPEPQADERGFFARTFGREDFDSHGLNPMVSQCSVSFNSLRGTVRGMHYQVAPHQEAKLIRCTSGAAYDVVVDLRPESAAFRRWAAVEITADNRHMIYVPEGVAHGFQTLADDTEIFYQISTPYVASHARGARWDDPAFGIVWPLPCRQISPKDRDYPDLRL